MTFIEKENLKKYLLYAIGEILLVMVGISLAFQLDNWNEDRIKKNTAIGHYKNIKSQINDDQILLESQIEFNKAYTTQFTYALQILEANDRTKMDTLGLLIRNMTQYSDFDKQGNIYETMVNSGEIKLLKNQEIVNGLRELEEKYNYLNRIENIHYDAMMTYIVKSLTPLIKFSTAEIMKPEELYAYEFQNLVMSILQIMKEKDLVYQQALVEIKNVTRLIDLKLKDQ